MQLRKSPVCGRRAFCRPKAPFPRTRIVAGGGEQNGTAERRLVLFATGQTDGGDGAFQGPPLAPAAAPDRLGANEIIEEFQRNSGLISDNAQNAKKYLEIYPNRPRREKHD